MSLYQAVLPILQLEETPNPPTLRVLARDRLKLRKLSRKRSPTLMQLKAYLVLMEMYRLNFHVGGDDREEDHGDRELVLGGQGVGVEDVVEEGQALF